MASWYAKYAQRPVAVCSDGSHPSTLRFALRFLARAVLDDVLLSAFAYLRGFAPSATPRPVELTHQHIQDLTRVPPGQTTRASFSFAMPVRPWKIILDNASQWAVSDLSVGHQRQTAQAGDFPGELLSQDLAGDGLTFEVIPAGTFMTIDAKYVGDDPAGGLLSCKLICEVAIPHLADLYP